MREHGNHSYRPPSDAQQLRQCLNDNWHSVAIISVEEMDSMVRNAPADKRERLQAAWQKVRPAVEFGAGWYAGVQDVNTLATLVADLGAVASRVDVRNYGGKAHIILRGYTGRREILTGTRYLATNPKVITMGLGRAAAQGAVRSGGVLTIYLMTAYRVLDYFLTDTATMTQLVGALAADVVKAGIAVGAALAVEAVVAATTSIATVAVGPLVVVIVVGGIVAWGLGELDKRVGFTDKMIEGLEALEEQANEQLQETKGTVARGLADYVRSQTKRLVLVPR